MRLEALQPLTASRDQRGIRLYGAVAALVFASFLLQLHVGAAYDAVVLWLTAWAGQRRVDAVLTGVVELGVLGLCYGVYRATRPDEDEGLAADELVTLAGALGLLVVVGSFWLLGSVDVARIPTRILETALTPVLGLGLPAVVFARTVGVELRFAPPARGEVVLAGAVTGIGTLVALGRLGLVAVVENPSVGLGPFRLQYAPLDVLLQVLLPALLAGLGMALVYNGAIQEALRRRLGLAGAITAVTVVVGSSPLLLSTLVRSRDPVATTGILAGVAVLSVLVALLAALGARMATDRAPVDFTPTVAAASGLAVVISISTAVALATPLSVWVLSAAIGFGLVTATATVGDERSRTVWVPGSAFVAYFLVTDGWVASQVFALLG